MSSTSSILKHLHEEYTEPIRDPLWHNISLSPPLMRIIGAAPFQKLSRIRQLGAAYLVYPGATHTRFSHSLGVLHLARRIMIAILPHATGLDLTLEGVKAFLCAALLHDLGHFPFVHSLKELPLKEHESLTAEILTRDPLDSLLRSELGVEPALVAAIVDRRLPERGRSRELSFFRNILSGVLDPDKLDYLNRDAYFCGVPYGVQDTDFVISRMRPHPTDGIAVDAQGLTAVEHVLFAKYLMYRNVYWHKTVRIATAMIKKAVYLSLRSGALRPDDLYGLDDTEFFERLAAVRHPGSALARRVADRDLFKQIHEEPFRAEDPLHARLLDLDERTRVEEAIARRLSARLSQPIPAENVIIDIPEPVAFEVSIPVVTSRGSVGTAETDSVFSAPVVEGFTRSLRKLRVIGPQRALAAVADPQTLLVEG